MWKIYFKHIKTVLTHKYWVFIYCWKLGLVWRGIKHDLSKFSPTEFFESIKYYTGTRSPIDVCKEDKGYSNAWQHHKGRNRHHYEYWIDIDDKGATPIQMPLEDAMELICDYLAAGRTYMGKEFSYASEFNWWDKFKRPTIKHMHPQTIYFIDLVLFRLQVGKLEFNRKNLISAYKIAESTTRERAKMRQSRN